MQRDPPANPQGRKFFVHTFGCQMNLADSERMAGALEAGGYECTTDASAADILIYNTCSIREKAENKVYSALGRQAKRKRDHFGDVKIVVAGCVAQQEGQALLRRVPEVDVVMGPQHANQIVSLVEQAQDGQVCAGTWYAVSVLPLAWQARLPALTCTEPRVEKPLPISALIDDQHSC